MKLEVVTIPVSDVDRAKEFYEGLGWRLDGERDADWPSWYAAFMIAEHKGEDWPLSGFGFLRVACGPSGHCRTRWSEPGGSDA